MSVIRVLVADDHGVLRKGIRYLLSANPEIEVIGEANDGNEAVRMAEQLEPDVVVMDISMPRLNGLDAAAQLNRMGRPPAVIMLSMYSDEEYLVRALSAGAKGYLLKDAAEPDLVRAVIAVSKGKPYFSPEIVELLLDEHVQRLRREGMNDSYDALTEREREVLQLLAEGKTNKEAATILDIATGTVETHRHNLMQKLKLHNTAELVVYAVKKKILRV